MAYCKRIMYVTRKRHLYQFTVFRSVGVKVSQTPWNWKTRMDKAYESINLVYETWTMDQSFNEKNFSPAQTGKLLYHSTSHDRMSTYVPEWHEKFVVSLLVPYTKINSGAYSLERWKSFHVSRCARNRQLVRCKSGTTVFRGLRRG
jgi:hypothetical protein